VKSRDRLSMRQRKILATIRRFLAEFGYPPTIRQIGADVGISSTSVVSYNLDALQRKGYLIRDPDVSRGLRLVKDKDSSRTYPDPEPEVLLSHVTIPLLGMIAAGEPIPIPDSDFAPADYEQISMAADAAWQSDEVYALRVRGTSMIDALIDDGDIVILRHQRTGENGDMVAAWLKDERATTLKRIYWEKDRQRVRLQPANPLMEPIYVHPGNLEIQGKVIGVLRHLD